MKRPYLDLKYELAKQDIDLLTVAERLGIARTNLSRKLNLHTNWTLYEAYQICQIIGRPLEDIPKLFPVEDVKTGEEKKGKKLRHDNKS